MNVDWRHSEDMDHPAMMLLVTLCGSGLCAELPSGSEEVRLVGGASRCTGWLERKRQERWEAEVEYDILPRWNFELADGACKSLNCGSVVSIKRIDTFPDRPDNPLIPKSSNVRKIKPLNVEITCSDSLESPNISISSTSGVSKARNQGLQVFFGTSFTITCSSHDLYQGGVFRLIFLNSTTSLNNTLPAANSSALFSFFEASYFHQGDYICVHHVQINSQNLQLQSQPLSLTVLVSVSLNEFIIRHVVVLLMMTVSTSALYVYFKSRRLREPKRNPPADDGPALRPSERRRLQDSGKHTLNVS
ncbi:uncharacterized protein LOC105355452 isoform X1 [Oryzias latipes]